MLKVIITNPLDFLRKHHNEYDAVIFPDFIVQRNFEISVLKDGSIENLPQNTFTLFTFAKELSGMNVQIIPRFLEREIAHIALQDLNYFRDLHDNEHFITDLLSEYWEIKENVIAGKKIIMRSRFFELFDSKFSRIIENLENGVNIGNNIIHFYSRTKILELINNKINPLKFKKILFCCFYYVGPGLKKFFDKFRFDYDITLIINATNHEAEEFLIKNLNPDDVEKSEIELPDEISLQSLPDQRREIKYIATFILEKIHSGYSFSDFIVAVPDAKEYEKYLEEIFPEYSIPYFIEARTKLIELPSSNALIGSLKKIEFSDIDQFVQKAREIILNLAKENSIHFTKNIGRLFNAIDDFKNEYKIIYPYLYGGNARIIDMFISFLSTTKFGRNLENLESVQVIDIGNISLRNARYIILAGMRDGYYPRPYSNRIVFPEIFNENNLYFRNQDVHEKYEVYKFYEALTSAKKVLFTYPYLDAEGKRYLESYLIKKLEKDLGIKIKREIKSASSLVFGDIIFNDKDLDISKMVEGNNAPQENFEIICDEKLRNEILGLELTPTHITTYNTCPRKFYFRYIKKLEVPVKPFSPPFMGTIVHDILEKFYGKYPNLSELNKSISQREISLKDEIEKIAEGMGFPKEKEFAFHVETIKKDAIKAIRNDLNIDTQRKVVEREKDFALEIYGTKIKGRIDRMDILEETYVLMDYKYSSVSHIRKLFIFNEQDLLKAEKDLSLPIYILWLEKYYNPKSFVAFYFPVRAKIKKGRKWLYLYTKGYRAKTPGWANYQENKFWNEQFRNSVERRILDILKNIRDCKFPVTDEENICLNCEFKLICRGDVD